MTTSTDVVLVEYLYQPWMFEDNEGYLTTEVRHLRITKRTGKRIFFNDMFGRPKSVDRETVERDGCAGVGRGTGRYFVYADRAAAGPAPAEPADDRTVRLRTEAAEAHPDRGGDPAVFRDVHARYRRALGTRAVQQ